MVFVVAISSLLYLAAGATGAEHEVYRWNGVGWILATDEQATMSSTGGESQQYRFFSSGSVGSSGYDLPEPGSPSRFVIQNIVRLRLEPCGDVNPLIAGQDFDSAVGKVFIWNDAVNLYVNYQINPPWYMTETQVNVDIVPPSGNVAPGHFTSKHTEDHPPPPTNPEDLHTILLSSLSFPVEPGVLVYIMAHAVVNDGDTEPSETAWKEGFDVPGQTGHGWAMYHEYTIR